MPGGNGRVFGQAMRKQRTKYQRQFGGGSNHSKREAEKSEAEILAQRRAEYKRQRQQQGEAVDVAFGYARFDYKSAAAGETRRGWIFNMLATTVSSVDSSAGDATSSAGPERSGLDLYFQTESGSTFKSTVLYNPYFYVIPQLAEGQDQSLFFESIVSTLMRLYEGMGLEQVEVVHKVDLDQVNHLSPKNRDGRPMLKLIFPNVQQLMDVRRLVQETVRKNQRKEQEGVASLAMFDPDYTATAAQQDPMTALMDIREYDVPYIVRVCTDLEIRAGAWYTVTPNRHNVGVALSDQNVEKKAHPSYLAFDIECTKPPLKFPDAQVDSIFMISYMVNGQGYLILSRHVVSQDVHDFEYTPKPSYPGPFTIFNEATEEALLRRFFDEYIKHKPQIVVTYNGDFFDWPFVEQRAAMYGMDIWTELGIEKRNEGEYRGRCCVHLDAFHWVQRDSYLPQGAQGLKAVTKNLLGYDPVEVDPEDMVRFAQERPVHMSTYSVSDAVATYYLYEKYVHMFIFSLATIIPMGPEDVLTKGSGTLCETLLMVQACSKSIICPNKQTDALAKFHQGHLLESETYIGGKVECLETGVYRSDVEYDFDLKSSAFQELIDNIDRDLTFAIEVEGGIDRSKVTNYNEIRSQIVEQLEMLRDRPKRVEKPYIYHLDVGAMYPNIILTNRLQPSAIVDDATCAACDFNQSKNGCKRHMDWVWRGDYNPATKSEYDRTKDQLSREMVDGQPFHLLPEIEQAQLVASRLKTYSRNAYRKTKVTEEITRTDTVCMRENDFYVDTVRRFRDRRYELKKLTKSWKKKIGGANDSTAKKEAEDRALVYDSLQVAHKCILNSFYGYVMRKGARWRSMEMAGIVTKTGADLITQARILVEQIGRPLELDTDGIWCILPKSFPDEYNFKTSDGGKLKLEYPCVMLNADVHANFTNHQYQTLKDPERGTYEARSECSIFFEVDGPYRCMVLPSSTEEGKLLKKRYAVFNFDGSLAELKGFELKRRGELELIKTFQSQVFERFLDGDSLVECYDSVAEIANHWIDVLDTQGESLDDDELVDLISENRNMSRQLEDYGDQKGTSQTTARRLGEFLGAEIIKDKGLNCKFIIAEQPFGAPVTERAIPTAIWKADPAVMKHYLRKWLKSPGMEGDDFDIRNVLDWEYYVNRLGKTIQKIITIPAALQKVQNPVPRIPHPDWLESKVRQLHDKFKQQSIRSMFGVVEKAAPKPVADMEDFGINGKSAKRPMVHKISRKEPLLQIADSETTATELAEVRLPLAKDTSSFGDWLHQKKAHWRQERREKKRLRVTARGSQSGSVSTGETQAQRRPVTSMEGYIRDAARALTQREWQVVEVREMTASEGSGSGRFVLWVMVGNESLQKILVMVPRVVYVASHCELKQLSGEIQVKKVDKHLPHNKAASFVYEVTMPEHLYHSRKWTLSLHPASDAFTGSDILEAAYETSTPLMLRALVDLGCILKTDNSASESGTLRKSFQLHELTRVAHPTEGEYMHSGLAYRRVFIYNGVNPRTKTGVVAVFQMESEHSENDLTRPLESEPGSLKLSAACHIWIVKPGSKRAQKNITAKQCKGLFTQLLETITNLSAETEAAGQTSQYSCVSSESHCQVSSLNFVDNESMALAAVNEAANAFAKSNSGPTFLLVNSGKPMPQLRRAMPSLNSAPVVLLPFPPGAAHNPATMALPALNWESPAVQLCMEAFFYMGAISFAKRVGYARYGNLPIGNLGLDESVTLYDVSLSRQLVKSRALSWASASPGNPDLGVSALPSSEGGDFPLDEAGGLLVNEEEIWGDEAELISPVISRPGAYRSVCVEIDVHDLAIAALTDLSAAMLAPSGLGAAQQQNETSGPTSPNSVSLFDGANAPNAAGKSAAPLGDEMSTSLSLQLLRVLIGSWLRDAFEANSAVSDDMLHHLYRLISSPSALMNDPALHRAVHALMKTTFLRLLGEFQRLGCTIVLGSFHKITVATNKATLSEAEEYIDFVLSTIKSRSIVQNDGHSSGGLARVGLRPGHYYCEVLFHDEYNYGGIELERRDVDEMEDLEDVIIEDGDPGEPGSHVVPFVVSGWGMMNYVGNDIAQEYFRVIVARFSKDVMRKEIQLRSQSDTSDPKVLAEELLEFKRKLVSKHFSSYLTRAVDEIAKDGGGPESFPRLPGSHLQLSNPPLEFIKSVITVLELDVDVQKEVQLLKRSLLSQIGVPEYSKSVKWQNPCSKFILPDVFCMECNECRDLNLCDLPALDGNEAPKRHWACDECGTPYDTEAIERRLVEISNRKVIRYQLQDLRCTKTNRVSTKIMSKHSDCSAELKLDLTKNEALTQLQILHDIAQHHELEWLEESSLGLLNRFQDE